MGGLVDMIGNIICTIGFLALFIISLVRGFELIVGAFSKDINPMFDDIVSRIVLFCVGCILLCTSSLMGYLIFILITQGGIV